MIVGLPGTGIGGLFYLFMAFWMPVNELYRLVQGRSTLERWKFIAFNWMMIGAILSTLWVTMLGVKALMAWTGTEKPSALVSTGIAQRTTEFFASAGWASAVSLIVLVGIVHVLRLTVGRGARRFATAEELPGPLPVQRIDE
jgi:hypothetical protein